MVANVRRQFSRNGANFYLQFWKGQLRNFGKGVDLVVAKEYEMRKSWVDHFRAKVSLESCVRESIHHYSQ